MQLKINPVRTAIVAGTVLIVLSVILKGRYLFVLSIVLFAVMLLFRRPELRMFFRIRFLVFILLPVLTGVFFIGERNLHIAAVRVSSEGIFEGIQMSGRALCLLFSFSIVLSKITTGKIIGFFERYGLKGMGLALGVASNTLATIAQNSSSVYHTLRLRGGFRKRPIKSFSLFVVAVISSSIRHADDIVHAAIVRGFDTDIS